MKTSSITTHSFDIEDAKKYGVPEATTLLRETLQRPIAFHRVNVRITKSITAGLLLSQLWYWWNAVGNREFYKTDFELMEETCLGKHEFAKAKQALKSLKIIQAVVKGVPAKTFYSINEKRYLSLINALSETSFSKNGKLGSSILENQFPEKRETRFPKSGQYIYRTENTTENISPLIPPQGESLLGDKFLGEEKHSAKEDSPTPFENFWNSYPRKIGKHQAEAQFNKNLKKHRAEAMLESTQLYGSYCKQAKLQPKYIKTPAAFLRDYWNDEGALKEWKMAISKTKTAKIPYDAMPSNVREKLLKLLDQEELFDDHGRLLTRNSGIIKEYLQTSYWNGLPKAVQEAIVNDQDGFEKMKKPQYPEPDSWKDYLRENYKPTAQIQKCLDEGWKVVPEWLKMEIVAKVSV